MRNASLLLAAGVAGLFLVFGREAHALGPLDLEVGAKVGAATNPSSAVPNPLGFGLGGRAGLSLLGIYAGANVMYYFGGATDTAAPTGLPGTVHESKSSLLYGFEGGYGFKLLEILTIRPQLGIGNLVAYGSFSSSRGQIPQTSSTDSELYLEPGVTALLGLGTLFVGADVNALVFPSDGVVSLSAHAQLGVKF